MKSLNLLDNTKNSNIIIAGILALIVGVGVARFSFTSFLPTMLDDSLALTFSGVLASINYIGYSSGSILAIFIKDLKIKVKLFQIGMILCVLSTILMGVSQNDYFWLFLRFIAGFGAAMGLVVGSAIVMYKIQGENKTFNMGVHFSGIGFSILICDLFISYALKELSWQEAWIELGYFGAFLAIYPLYILRIKEDLTHKINHTNKKSLELFSPFVIILIVSYFCAGIGFVINGTFLPSIIRSLEGLESWGGISWTIVGIAAIPSCILWAKAGAKYGEINAIVIANLVQVIGILIPTFSKDPYLNIFGAMLYGGTFAGIVALVLAYGGKLAGKNPVILMGALTSSYSIGQIIGPLYAVGLTDWLGTFTYALYLTAIIVSFGAIILYVGKIKFKIIR